MKPIYVMLFVALFNLNAIAQSVNDYKYVLVPDRFSWTNGPDEFQVNSLTTFLFKKYGFDAYQLGNVFPADMNVGGCNSLTADIEESSSFVRTKLKIVLKDCKGDIVFISDEGTSKEKDYKRAYHESLRSAFLSIKELEYSYTSSQAPPQKNVQKSAATESISKDATRQVSTKADATSMPIEVAMQGQEIQNYKGLDGTYSMTVDGGIMKFYEGEKEIGTSSINADNLYKIENTEFKGKGYFLKDQFIVERRIKGVQGVVKMIFNKK